jgi:hypothetical protein
VDVGLAFEIPPGAPTQFQAKSPWEKDRSLQPVRLNAGTPFQFSLAPFQVLTLEATPVTH